MDPKNNLSYNFDYFNSHQVLSPIPFTSTPQGHSNNASPFRFDQPVNQKFQAGAGQPQKRTLRFRYDRVRQEQADFNDEQAEFGEQMDIAVGSGQMPLYSPRLNQQQQQQRLPSRNGQDLLNSSADSINKSSAFYQLPPIKELIHRPSEANYDNNTSCLPHSQSRPARPSKHMNPRIKNKKSRKRVGRVPTMDHHFGWHFDSSRNKQRPSPDRPSRDGSSASNDNNNYLHNQSRSIDYSVDSSRFITNVSNSQYVLNQDSRYNKTSGHLVAVSQSPRRANYKRITMPRLSQVTAPNFTEVTSKFRSKARFRASEQLQNESIRMEDAAERQKILVILKRLQTLQAMSRAPQTRCKLNLKSTDLTNRSIPYSITQINSCYVQEVRIQSALLIQSWWRTYLAHKNLIKFRGAVMTIQRFVKYNKTRKIFMGSVLILKKRAALLLQACCRGYLSRKESSRIVGRYKVQKAITNVWQGMQPYRRQLLVWIQIKLAYLWRRRVKLKAIAAEKLRIEQEEAQDRWYKQKAMLEQREREKQQAALAADYAKMMEARGQEIVRMQMQIVTKLNKAWMKEKSRLKVSDKQLQIHKEQAKQMIVAQMQAEENQNNPTILAKNSSQGGESNGGIVLQQQDSGLLLVSSSANGEEGSSADQLRRSLLLERGGHACQTQSSHNISQQQTSNNLWIQEMSEHLSGSDLSRNKVYGINNSSFGKKSPQLSTARKKSSKKSSANNSPSPAPMKRSSRVLQTLKQQMSTNQSPPPDRMRSEQILDIQSAYLRPPNKNSQSFARLENNKSEKSHTLPTQANDTDQRDVAE